MYLRNTRLSYRVLAGLAVAALALPVVAQETNIRTITRYRVKPDRVGEFQSAVKEYSGVLKKAGWDKGSTWWQSLSGPREYVLVRYFTKWAELDVIRDPKLKDYSGELTSLSSRINQCTDSAERIVEELQMDLSLPMNPEIPKMVRTHRSLVKPDKVNEFMSVLKGELLPAVKKAGVKSFGVARVRYGAPGSEFRSVMGFNSWADLDESPGPIVSAMGEAKYREFVARITPLVVESQYDMYRFMPDLSYVPAPSASPSGSR